MPIISSYQENSLITQSSFGSQNSSNTQFVETSNAETPPSGNTSPEEIRLQAEYEESKKIEDAKLRIKILTASDAADRSAQLAKAERELQEKVSTATKNPTVSIEEQIALNDAAYEEEKKIKDAKTAEAVQKIYDDLERKQIADEAQAKLDAYNKEQQVKANDKAARQIKESEDLAKEKSDEAELIQKKKSDLEHQKKIDKINDEARKAQELAELEMQNQKEQMEQQKNQREIMRQSALEQKLTEALAAQIKAAQDFFRTLVGMAQSSSDWLLRLFSR